MASQLKIQVLGVGELETGKNERSGREWHRRTLQIWTGEAAGNHTAYADEEVLKDLQAGNYMVDIIPRAGDRGRIEFVIGNLSPVVQARQEKPATT